MEWGTPDALHDVRGAHGRLGTIYVTHELYQRSSLSRLLFSYHGNVYLIWYQNENVTMRDDPESNSLS